MKKEGDIIDKFGIDSAEVEKNIEKLDKIEEKTIKKFTKDLPSLDEKPKKSFLRKIFSKPVLAVVATALVGAAAVALAVGAPPLLVFLRQLVLVWQPRKKSPVALCTLQSALLSLFAIQRLKPFLKI
ncbi:MAG: hypothetical protein IJU76_14825 [Desulfovibrionaceae bacterium]|nr:hypothetical protein [Desulfovibrionaceae bacterium]